MQQTQNYKLNKPDITDYAKIELLNDNADIIDAKLKDLEINGDLTGITQEVVDLQTQVTEHLEESMPHTFVDNGIKYRWGFRTLNGEPQFIYEEVM